MKLFTQRPRGGDDGDSDALNEPLFVVRNPDKAKELIRLGARPKKYRNIEDPELCFALVGVDQCLSAFRSAKRGLEVLAAVNVEHLSAADAELRAEAIAEVVAMVRRLGG